MAALDDEIMTEEVRRRLFNWASTVTNDLSVRLEGLPPELRGKGLKVLVIGLISEIIYRSSDQGAAIENLHQAVDAALEMQSFVEEKVAAMRDGLNREPGHG